MKALVTGSSGFIGSHLVEALVKKGYRVSCLIRETSDPKWIKDLDVQFITASYTDLASLGRAVRGMDYIFHVGAVIDALDWDTFYRANVESTANLLEACARENPGVKKFIFVSSIAAAGPAQDGRPVKESDAGRPVSQYGKSKLQAEEVAARFFNRLPIVILRPTNILGPRQKQLESMLKLAKMRIIPLVGRREKQTSICFVKDLVRALILVAEHPDVRSEIYFVASQEAYSWREILGTIRKELGLSLVIKIPYPLLLAIAFLAETAARLSGGSPLIKRSTIRSARNNYWVQDVGKIKEALGFSTQIGLEQGIAEIIRQKYNTAIN